MRRETCTRDCPNPILSLRGPQPRSLTKDRARFTSHVNVARLFTTHCLDSRLAFAELGEHRDDTDEKHKDNAAAFGVLLRRPLRPFESFEYLALTSGYLDLDGLCWHAILLCFGRSLQHDPVGHLWQWAYDLGADRVS